MCGIGVKNVPGVYMLLLGLGRVQDIEAGLEKPEKTGECRATNEYLFSC